MNSLCHEKIINEFYSKAFDGLTIKHYDCEVTDQLRIGGLVNLAQLIIGGFQTAEKITWKASGEAECYEWMAPAMLALGLDLKRHIQEKTDRFYALRIYINDQARTMDELINISWDMAI